MSVWKQLIILCFLGVAAYGGYEAYAVYTADDAADAPRRGDRPAPVELAQAEMRTLYETVEAVGTTHAAQSVAIVPETDGRVVEINVTPGAHVDAGAVLARLDDAIERADLAEAEARLTEQTNVLQRIERLRTTNAVSQATLEEATARLAEARAQLDRARRRLEDKTIRAPFGGVVGLTDVALGARVSEDDTITRLDDLGEVEIEFALPETLFARIAIGQSIAATSAAFPGQLFEGEIAAVDSRIDPVSRAFRTRALLPNPNGVLPAGMFMSLSLTLSESERLVVPEEAIVFQAAETYVFSVADGKATRLAVQTGERRDGVIAILSGLEDGDDIVVRGLQRVRDGVRVEILNATDPAPAVAAQENES